MKKTLTRYAVYFSVCFFILLFFSTLNWYKYNFDIDGTAYITIARHIAKGEWIKSFNGLWSPLNCWLAAPFMRFTEQDAVVFKIINAIACCGIIFQSYRLAKKFLTNNLLIHGILIILPVILLSYTHIQLAGDLLQLFFLLIYMNLVIQKDFFQRPFLNIVCAVIMGLAYLAKSYSLPFFIVFHASLYLINYWRNKPQQTVATSIKSLLTAYLVFFLFIAPWVYCLYIKYHYFTFSTAGALNYNWYLGNSSSTIIDTGLLIPPPYPDSFNYWEDPALYYHHLYGPLSSVNNFLNAIKLFLHNLKLTPTLFLEMSFCLLAIFVYWIIRYVKSTVKFTYHNHLIVMTASLILVFGYLFIHIETRYIWFTGIAGLLLGAALLEEKVLPALKKKWFSFAVVIIFLGSFIISPLDHLQDKRFADTEFPALKNFIATQSISGGFTCNLPQKTAWCTRLAFETSNAYYLLAKENYSSDELIDAIKQQHLAFYLYFYQSPEEKENFYSGTVASAAKKIIAIPSKNILFVSFQ